MTILFVRDETFDMYVIGNHIKNNLNIIYTHIQNVHEFDNIYIQLNREIIAELIVFRYGLIRL